MTEQDLMRETIACWDRLKNENTYISLKDYVSEKLTSLDNRTLLAAELEYAEKAGRLNKKPCTTLVLLLGFSLEPLLQLICVYNPQKILLIMNRFYGEEEGHVYGGRFKEEAVVWLKEAKLIGAVPEFLSPPDKPNDPGYIVNDDPAAIFEALTKAIGKEEDVIIDVTGGKKSMVTGAFLYAAYAGVPISYVDFDDKAYSTAHRRPYGYACKIGELSNPYQSFALREWEKVKESYKAYKFRDVLELLVGPDRKGGNGTIYRALEEYLPGAADGIKKMEEVVALYEKWDGGDFNGAAEIARRVRDRVPEFNPPDAVSCLGGKWCSVEPAGFKFTDLINDFYDDSEHLRVYVFDELKRIGRLICCNQDYRSAFIRAGSLSEVVMLARQVKLVEKKEDKEALLKAFHDGMTPGASSVYKKLLKDSGAIIKIGPKRNLSSREDYLYFADAPEIEVELTKKMDAWWKNSTSFFKADDGWDSFLKLRNQMVHKYFTVSREWAEDAFCFVTANFEDFLGQKTASLTYSAEAVSWKELCVLCCLTRFLPLKLRM
ncbi:MAG: CRISPR-associated protein [Peptococcaceae bacterium]|nr:MAG: CRISPR-associated protein [Peptococcaceae bacterium]